jgi:hypothetical protein
MNSKRKERLRETMGMAIMAVISGGGAKSNDMKNG